jgi:LAO/AO transport system kinase
LQTIASEDTGIDELVETILAHRRYLVNSGEWAEREIVRSRREIERLLQNQVLSRLRQGVPPERSEGYVAAVARRELDPYAAAERLFELLKTEN